MSGLTTAMMVGKEVLSLREADMAMIVTPDGNFINLNNHRAVPIGSRVATKGEVPCWEEKPTAGRREGGTISGVGEILKGPDVFDRYLCRIKGCKIWIHYDQMVISA